MNGMYESEVVPTLKHFPGDGETMKNQHLVTSANNMGMAEWNQTFGTMYQTLINDGVPSIMVGHIRFPAYQTDDLPATFSKELMVDLLKGEMKFNGAVMSDALNMGGAGGFFNTIEDIAVETFKAGVDLVLWPEPEYMDRMEQLILSGEVPMSRLDDAVQRIWGVREAHGLLLKKDDLFADDLSEAEKEESAAAAKFVAENAVTLVDDFFDEVPLSPAVYPRIGIISISTENIDEELQLTVDYLRSEGFEVEEIIHNPNWYAYQSSLSDFERFDKVLCMFSNRVSAPMGSSMLKGDEAMGAWTANMIKHEKMIAVSYGNPVYPYYYLDKAPIKVNAYSSDPFSQKAVVDALVGRIHFSGTTPVRLNDPAVG